MSTEPLSTDDLYSPNPNLYTGRSGSPGITVGTMLLVLLLMPFVLGYALMFLAMSSIGSGDTEGPAPEGSYAIRRAWGEEKLHHHFKAADKWVRESSQIAKDIGSVTGVAPIGAPNSFGSSFGESWASMNLQVVGTKGEGVLRLPNFCADDPNHLFGFDHDASWTFEDHRYPVFPCGKSWLQKRDFDEIYDQIFVFAEQQDHARVVEHCRTLATREAEGTLSRQLKKVFSTFPPVHRSKLVRQFADSLAETSSESSATFLYAEIAATELAHVLEQQQSYRRTKPKKEQVAKRLTNINAILKKAQALTPNKDAIVKLASWRSILAYQNQSGTMRFACEELDSETKKTLIREELKGMFEYAEQLAKTSPYLQAELGTITTRPRIRRVRLPEEAKMFWSGLPMEFAKVIPGNACESYCTLHLNPDGTYQSYIGIDIEGANGKTGRLSFLVQESHLDESQRDLFSETPRGPSDKNLTASLIRWKENGKQGSVSLNQDTLKRRVKK